MLSLTTSDSRSLHEVLDEPGSFVWWYVDIVDDAGRGAVLIWFWGLPFLPGSREHAPARARPGITVAIYDGGRPSFYLLQEHDAGEATIGPGADHWKVGASTLSLARRGGGCHLHGALDLQLPAPGGRAIGSLDLRGPVCIAPASAAAAASTHHWAPISVPARARLELQVGDDTYVVDGRAYFDGNRSDTPLEQLGIDDWHWGRIAMPDREVIYYLLWGPDAGEPEVAHLLDVFPDGRIVPHREPVARWLEPRRSIYGLRWHRQLHLSSASGLDLEVRHAHLVDDGPFYLRTLVEAADRSRGETGQGVAERVVPQKVDVPWQRPFVRMRRHLAGGQNSMWLPLFSGPRRGRIGRLVRQWSGASP